MISVKWCWLWTHKNDVLDIFTEVSKNSAELLIFLSFIILITKY